MGEGSPTGEFKNITVLINASEGNIGAGGKIEAHETK